MLRLLLLLIPFVPKGKAQVKIVNKGDSKLMKIFAILLRPISPAFMTDFYTTVGETIYIPEGVKVPPAQVVIHEFVHIKQLHTWGILFWILYALVLPLGFSPFRFHWELEAYLTDGRDPHEILRLLSGKDYGFAMPRPLAKKWIELRTKTPL